MFLNGGILHNSRILSPKTVQLITSNQVGDFNLGNPGVKFGLGFAIDLGPGRSGQIGSQGIFSWLGILNTSYWVDPEEELIGIIMTQLYPTSDVDIRDKYRGMVYQAVIE
jgi:CubicO group peptidase (beta-lactamase class C family)